MWQEQGNPHPLTAPPGPTPHLSAGASFLEEDGLKSEDTPAFPASATAQSSRKAAEHQAEGNHLQFAQYSLPASPAASHSSPGLIQSTQLPQAKPQPWEQPAAPSSGSSELKG